jgi:hypothetical protein
MPGGRGVRKAAEKGEDKGEAFWLSALSLLSSMPLYSDIVGYYMVAKLPE